MNASHSRSGNILHDFPIPIPGHEAVSHLYFIQSQKSALIDTGPASTWPLVLAKLAELQIDPAAIGYVLATHIHLDHLGGLSQALISMPAAKVIVHPRGLSHLSDPRRLWQASLAASGQIALEYGQPRPVPAEKLISPLDGQVIDLGGVRLEIIFTPGHAPHHLAFFDRQSGSLFAGEAAGVFFPDSGIVYPAAPSPFDPEQAGASAGKMLALHPRTIHYCHYGSSQCGEARLAEFQRSLALWMNTVKSFFKPGLELNDALVESIVNEIMAQNGSPTNISSNASARLKSELYFLRNNVRGFWDYFQRKGNPSGTK